MYDAHELLPVAVTDARGMTVGAAYNMRLLQPWRVTEPNGASTCVTYSPIGLPERQFVAGREEPGRPAEGGTAETAEISYAYDFLRAEAGGAGPAPIYVHTYRRVQHRSALVEEENARRAEAGRPALSDAELAALFPADPVEEARRFPERFIQSREYSDGFGRLVQTRAQAADLVLGAQGDDAGLGAAPGSAPEPAVGRRADDGVVVSGWERFDNKGRVVERFEPFFAAGWAFQPEAEAARGARASLFYDPRGQVVRTRGPDGSQQRVVFGRPAGAEALALTPAGLAASDAPGGFAPTPWERYTYDANDLAELTHPGGAGAPAEHHFTPASVVLDALGRAVCAVARNGPSAAQWHLTRFSYDIRGNLRAVTDALGRLAFSYHYDLLDRALAVESVDAGRRSSVLDALGNPVEHRDSKGSLALRRYNELGRLSELWARDRAGDQLTLRERLHYGDDGDAGDRDAARLRNALGRLVAHYDEAGLLETLAYDFKGNPLEQARRTIRDDRL
ncbi:MAG TPA: hypothetical protein PKD53_33900, partial [Chloroflexaceae bacterium]|nr:hypothetical protein [Chloroflexaceae bacterium]